MGNFEINQSENRSLRRMVTLKSITPRIGHFEKWVASKSITPKLGHFEKEFTSEIGSLGKDASSKKSSHCKRGKFEK